MLLQAWHGGDPPALQQLMTLVRREIHRLARHLGFVKPSVGSKRTGSPSTTILRCSGKESKSFGVRELAKLAPALIEASLLASGWATRTFWPPPVMARCRIWSYSQPLGIVV